MAKKKVAKKAAKKASKKTTKQPVAKKATKKATKKVTQKAAKKVTKKAAKQAKTSGSAVWSKVFLGHTNQFVEGAVTLLTERPYDFSPEKVHEAVLENIERYQKQDSNDEIVQINLKECLKAAKKFKMDKTEAGLKKFVDEWMTDTAVGEVAFWLLQQHQDLEAELKIK